MPVRLSEERFFNSQLNIYKNIDNIEKNALSILFLKKKLDETIKTLNSFASKTWIEIRFENMKNIIQFKLVYLHLLQMALLV